MKTIQSILKNLSAVRLILVNCFCFSICVIFVISSECFSQEFDFTREYDVIPVSFDRVECQVPWTTGYNYINPTFCDIDGDNDYDLVIGSDWGRISVFTNNGNNNNPAFCFESDSLVSPPNYVPLAQQSNRSAFCDIDNDGDFDLFSGYWLDEPIWYGRLAYYENIGTNEYPVFELETESFQGIDTQNNPNPIFVDIDNDNDFDLFFGEGQWYSITAGRIRFYLNEGTPDSVNMVLVSEQFEGIDIGDECIPSFIDIDNDSDYDMFLGDEDGMIHFYRNDGTPEEYNFTFITDHYAGVDVANIASPTFCDIDGDGDYDLFVGERSWGEDDNHGDVWFYENIGSPDSAAFQLIMQNFVTMDIGRTAPTAFADINNDGLTDMFIGDSDGNINYFANIGTETEPGFALTDQNFQNISANYQSRPTFGDLDGDNDLDLLIGRASFNTGSIHYYRNDGTVEVPNYNLITQNYLNIDYELPAPCLIDIDNDNDLDLFVGKGNNQLTYWENQGTSLNPQFVLIDSNYLNTSISYDNFLYCFGDIDDDGDYDILRGTIDGFVNFYRNIGNTATPIYLLEQEHFLNIKLVAEAEPFLEDIDGDGDLDLFVGDYSGGVSFWRNNEGNSVNREPSTVNRSFTLLPNYPNPFNASTTIPFTLDQKLSVKIVVYNQLGQNVITLFDGIMNSGMHQVNWDAGNVSSGFYLIRLDTQIGYSESRKVMLVK